jgi:hypothetical protein
MTEREPDRAERLFEQLAVRLLADPAVGQGTGFGSAPGLRVGGKIFAMLRGADLVVKLPEAHVDQLVGSGTGAPFDPRGDGRRMREWAAIPERHGDQWDQLADEALAFVRRPR